MNAQPMGWGVGLLMLPACLWVTDAERLEREADLAVDTAPTVPDLVDADGDGSPEGEDCDDSDPARTPGADEVCDGVDNDCDDEIDEDAIDATLWFADSDGDGFVDVNVQQTACEPPEGHLAKTAADCDDTNGAIHPAAPEVLRDSIDQNCDDALGPVAVFVDDIVQTGHATAVLERATRDASESVVLAWLSTDCPDNGSTALCAGTLDWEPIAGETVVDAGWSTWFPDVSGIKRIVSFDYIESTEGLWAWIADDNDDRMVQLTFRSIDGTQIDVQDEVFGTAADSAARVDLQHFVNESNFDILMACDPEQGAVRWLASSGGTSNFVRSSTVTAERCSVGTDIFKPYNCASGSQVLNYDLSMSTATSTDFEDEVRDLTAASVRGDYAVEAVLTDTQLLFAWRENLLSTSFPIAETAINLSGGNDHVRLTHEPDSDHTWACLVGDDGMAQLISLPDFSDVGLRQWNVEGVENVRGCSVVALTSQTVVVALTTDDGLWVAEADWVVE